MLSLIFKILRDKVGELYNSINRKIQPLPFGDDQDYILDSDTVTVSDFWKDFKKYSQSPALIGVFYVFLLLNIIINLFIIIMSISNLSNHYLGNHLLSLIMALFWLFMPPFIWMYSTRYVFWNYHLYKYGSLILLALNDLIIIQKFIMSSFYPSLIHFLSIIPVGEYIGKDMIMQLGVFLFAGLPPLIPIYIGCKLYGTFSSDLVLDEIDRFKLDHYIDFRKSKEFAYDFKAVRYLSTGSQFIVKELDRFLHMYCDGTTGTAKTSSVLTVAIADDLDQKVYNEDYPSQIVFTACFSIFEPMVSVAATVSGNTDIDTNQSHQQVSFAINNKNFPITYPQTDLKIWVYQNNRRDNAVTGLQPMTILENQISYTNNQNLIFPAGNEYRRMEFLSNKYNGMHVESISFHNPYYHVELMTDYRRDQLSYQYDQDQDGRFFIRCSNCNDPDTEADYYIVHFTLAMDLIPDGNVYLNGELYNNVLDEKSKMGYNPETHQYEKSVLLKQGSYNYQYLFVPNGQTVGQTGPIEGNFFQTENEYSIYVYYCPMGARYDRLIGVTSIRNTMPVL